MWRIEKRGLECHIINKDGFMVATALNNSDLIATAPDMYDLLNDILGWDGILPHSKKRIEQVLKKAEGGAKCIH